MSQSSSLPQLPEDRIQLPLRRVSEVVPGEQVVLNTVGCLRADEQGHVWANALAELGSMPIVPGMSLRAERTEAGFILWLDNEVKFRLQKLSPNTQFLPVTEFRET